MKEFKKSLSIWQIYKQSVEAFLALFWTSLYIIVNPDFGSHAYSGDDIPVKNPWHMVY